MRRIKRVMTLGLTAAIGVSGLTGCYTKVTADNYATTVVATFGDENIYLNEVNFYLKMLQVTYDSYYEYFYGPYYGYASYQEFYENTDMTDNGTSIWEAMKEDAMAAVLQTHVLCERAAEYQVSLTDEDQAKISEAVAEFLQETDAGVLEACKADEELVTKLFTDNALANRVYEYLVSDIDTAVDEADYRYTQVAYLTVKEKTSEDTEEAETTDASAEEADDAEEAAVDLETRAADVLASLNDELAAYAASGEEDDSIPFNAVIDAYSEDGEIELSYTASTQYGKPEETEDGTETLQSFCWNNLKTGDTDVYYDEANSTAYVLYCTEDDVEDAKQSAIEEELDSRRTARFEEKYPDILSTSSTFTVISRVYSQLDYEDIPYASTGDISTSDNDVDASGDE